MKKQTAGWDSRALDRFGRVVNQLWTTSDMANGTSGDTLGTTTEQFQYGYDQAVKRVTTD